ncbi:MAG TPA: zinc ribbon domain-containing protein [Solirubrobacterales bacterium]|nr:zinc ribbon domain-containing protein [Solirubrobacterales bacterium]
MKLTGSRKAKLGPTRKTPQRQAPAGQPGQPVAAPGEPTANTLNSAYGEEFVVDLQRRRDQLVARVAELQWDLGGLVYEMAVRNSIKIEVIVKRAVVLQDADAELSEVERILRMEETGAAGSCKNCGAPHSSGATFCWQCGKPLLEQVSGDAILRR